MDLITREDLKGLLKTQSDWCVSIYLPTEKVGKDAHQNPIRFKNLLKVAENHLLTLGVHPRKAEQFLSPCQNLLQNSIFWTHQSDGLAVFQSKDTFRYFRLPLKLAELVVVTNRFQVKPLLPLFIQDGRFYILTLSKKSVRLLQGTRFGVSEIDLQEVPKSLAQAIRYDEPKKQLQFHTGTPSRTGKRAAIFHGHGAGFDETKELIFSYFQKINKGLHNLLKKEKVPLVLAGVKYLQSIYHKANTYPYLTKQGITGNPEKVGLEELHNRGYSLLRPIFQKSQKQAFAHYRQLAGSGRTSNNLKVIVPAAYKGMVEYLMVAVGIQKWGTFYPDSKKVLVHSKEIPGDEDLLDFAAGHTLRHHGTVYAVKPEMVPDQAPVVAVFRY